MTHVALGDGGGIVTRRTAGRTTAFAGSTLLLSMMVAFFIVPGSLLASLAATVALVVVLSVLVATSPARRFHPGRPEPRPLAIGAPPGRGAVRGLMTVVGRPWEAGSSRRRDRRVLLSCSPRRPSGLKTGPPNPEQLDKDSPARQDANSRQLNGPGLRIPVLGRRRHH